MGFLKKLKETAEKGIEKGAELGTKGYDAAKDAAGKGHEKARQLNSDTQEQPTIVRSNEPYTLSMTTSGEGRLIQPQVTLVSSAGSETAADQEVVKILKMRLAKGEITPQQFEEMLKVLSESTENTSTSANSNIAVEDTTKSYGDLLESFPPLKDAKWKEAVKEAEKMIQKDPSDPKAWFIKAWALNISGIYEGARQAVDRLLSIDPNASKVWYLKAYCSKYTGHTAEALIAIDRAVSINKNYGIGWAFRAELLFDLKRYEEALASAKEAVRSDPNLETAWYYQGKALSELGSNAQASACFDRAITESDKLLSKSKDDKDKCAPLWTKAASLDALGRNKEAKEYWKKYHKITEK
jgi:tetratricopeptide (TPR) repeat protein